MAKGRRSFRKREIEYKVIQKEGEKEHEQLKWVEVGRKYGEG